MIKKLYAALCADEKYSILMKIHIFFIFSCNEMGIINIDLNGIIFDNNYDEDDPDTNTLVKCLAWLIKFEKRKVLKNNN